MLSSKTDGAIVRSLDDKTTRFVSSRIHNFSHLESIEVYTVRDNVNLVDILKAMEASTTKLPDEKDGGALKNYFTKVYPDLDFGRVYSSDLKKMVKWFQVLKANDIEIKLTEPDEAEETAETIEDKPVVETKAPANKSARGKSARGKGPAGKGRGCKDPRDENGKERREGEAGSNKESEGGQRYQERIESQDRKKGTCKEGGSGKKR